MGDDELELKENGSHTFHMVHFVHVIELIMIQILVKLWFWKDVNLYKIVLQLILVEAIKLLKSDRYF